MPASPKVRETRGWKEKGAFGPRSLSLKVSTFGVEAGAVPGVNEVSGRPGRRVSDLDAVGLYRTLRGVTVGCHQTFEELREHPERGLALSRDHRAYLQRLQRLGVALAGRSLLLPYHVSVVEPVDDEEAGMKLVRSLLRSA